MPLKVLVRDGTGKGSVTKVSDSGELMVVGYGENISKFITLNINTTAFNYFIAKPGFNFFITSILFNIVGGATVMNIYEASSPTSIVMIKELIRIDTAVTGFQTIIFSFGGFLKVTEGVYLNAQTTSQPNSMTIIGFYKPIPTV